MGQWKIHLRVVSRFRLQPSTRTFSRGGRRRRLPRRVREPGREHIEFNTNVERISKAAPDQGYRFDVDTTKGGYKCKLLVIATGVFTPKDLDMIGWDLVEQYRDIPADGAAFDNERVAIFGNGNTAHEIAQALFGHSAHTHVFSRRPPTLSFHSHYVGDLRAVNNGLLDTYQLKSLDAIIDVGAPLEEMYAIIRCSMDDDLIITYGTGDKKCPCPAK